MKSNTQSWIYLILLILFSVISNNCSKKEINVDNAESGTLKDVDGNTYKMIQIGNQVWMAENLKTSKFRNGDPIPYVIGELAWTKLKTGAFCWYNDAVSSKATYGALYNWYAVKDSRQIAPNGWHIPSDNEWLILTNYLVSIVGHSEGGSLKETGTSHWLSPNTGANNSTGFTGLPGGLHGSEGYFDNLGLYGYWWSNTATYNLAWSFTLNFNNNTLDRGSSSQLDGLSVRCIKD